jgi:hypothetical protein
MYTLLAGRGFRAEPLDSGRDDPRRHSQEAVMRARSLVRRGAGRLAGTNAESVHLFSTGELGILGTELEARGRTVQRHRDVGSLLVALEELPGGAPAITLVAHVQPERSRETLAAVTLLRRLHPSVRLVLLLDDSTDSPAWTRAAGLTTACFPSRLEPGVLAALISESAGRPTLRPAQPRMPARRLVLTLWESVVLDDEQVYLGVAERNFLFTLARKPGIRLAKSTPIEAGPGRHLGATSCRRRLGQRLGPELTELLVPCERYEPYRMREPQEIEAVSAGLGLGPVTLRIVGRAEVRLAPAAAGFG